MYQVFLVIVTVIAILAILPSSSIQSYLQDKLCKEHIDYDREILLDNLSVSKLLIYLTSHEIYLS